jgi:hypothetical protein
MAYTYEIQGFIHLKITPCRPGARRGLDISHPELEKSNRGRRRRHEMARRRRRERRKSADDGPQAGRPGMAIGLHCGVCCTFGMEASCCIF